MSARLKFDPNLEHQIEAVRSATDLFKGQPSDETITEYLLDAPTGQSSIIHGVRNNLVISPEQLLENLRAVQEEHLPEKFHTKELKENHFSVEMETGTGKTYVYIRTIYELNQLYGFKKFLIVVPSVAIREGVIKNLQITHDHFQTLYDNVPVNYYVYGGSTVSQVKGFATNNGIEILVINIDAFAKDENIINKPHEKTSGLPPIRFIQDSCPIVIVDEPQNMETEKRRNAIKNLNPAVTLRYSATHRNTYNLIYSLNPVKAYDLGLVKQIEVDSILEENSSNSAFVEVEKLNSKKTSVSAKLRINVNTTAGVKKKLVTARVGDDLYQLSGEREMYSEGYIVEDIDVANGCVSFLNGNLLYQGQSQGGLDDEVMKMQVRKTIEEHLKKERRLSKRGIKVLSLFFIDKVSNYREYQQDGSPSNGKFALWFEEIYTELIKKPAFKDLGKHPVHLVHNGYFAQDKRGKWKDTKETSASMNSQDAADTFNLIMRDKEALLDQENPLRFIFSHSALREGWDNPNVFQICTLNETKSDIKKRQEIGRGLRLAVVIKDGIGMRTYDRSINKLTVIANESYEDFAKALQNEIEVDFGIEFKNRIKNRRDRTSVKLRKGFEVDAKFLEIWERICQKTRYRVDYSTSALIEAASAGIRDLPEIKPPSIRSTKVSVLITDKGVNTGYVGDRVKTYESFSWKIPDILGYLQSKSDLTRSTIYAMLTSSGRLPDVLVNPQLFLDQCAKVIRGTLLSMMVDGIKYEKIGGKEYQMTSFRARELEVYLNDFSFSVTNTSKTIYENFIPLDSDTENQFARDCESSEQVEFYFKLPNWFKISTPVGSYNPDWAIVFRDDKKIYFVAETKNTGDGPVDRSKLKLVEQLKIKCGEKHFSELPEVDYKVVSKVGDLI